MIRISEILMATVIVWMEEVDSFFGPEVIGGPFFMKRKVINYITQTAIFGGLAAILYCVPGLQFKIPFVAPGFMEIHLDEIPILISSFAYGPLLGIFEKRHILFYFSLLLTFKLLNSFVILAFFHCHSISSILISNNVYHLYEHFAKHT